MPRYIRMPSEDEIPEGPRRDFVSKLHEVYQAAMRPSVQAISERGRELAERNPKLSTASRETVRRMLTGESVSTTAPNWESVEVVYRALCDLAGKNPDATYVRSYGYGGDEERTHRQDLLELWNQALDAPPVKQRAQPQPSDNPWRSAQSGWAREDPPF